MRSSHLGAVLSVRALSAFTRGENHANDSFNHF